MNDIKLIVLDVDGTLTDGRITLDNNGIESKSFNVKDGLAIAQAIKIGIDIIIVTGRNSEITNIRSKELGIKEVYQGIKDKITFVTPIILKKSITMEDVAYIGDDINDLAIMKNVAFPACPSDASIEVKKISKFVSSFAGGEGAVREIIEHILQAKGVWKNIINNYSCVNQ